MYNSKIREALIVNSTCDILPVLASFQCTNKVFIMLGHLVDQNQFWLDNFAFYSDTTLSFETIVLYYTACSHDAFMVSIFC